VKAVLVLLPDGEPITGGSVVAEVERVIVSDEDDQSLPVVHLETCVRRAAAARLEREPEGHPLIVYLRASEPVKPTPRGS
jgi:hypothetical protein